jgi:hypothetical protein
MPSPGSWGSDIISLSHDWPGTFILEAAEAGLAKQIRRNFRGYRLAPAQYKLFLSRRRLPVQEQRRLENNGFTTVIVGQSAQDCGSVFAREVSHYIQDQIARI